MRVVILSADGSGLGLGLRLKREGAQVVACLPKMQGTRLYDGLLQKISFSDIKAFKPDIVLVDHVGLANYANQLRSDGIFVFNGYTLGDKLELDRDFGIQAFKEAGLRVPESQNFTDPKAAARWLEKRNWDGAVIKPHESAKGIKIMTTVFKNREEAVRFLFDAPQRGLIPIGQPFVLQQFIRGIEISTEWWMVDGKVLPHSVNHTLEEKLALAGNLGAMTGCSTSIVFMNTMGNNTPFHTEVVQKFSYWLESKGTPFSGCFDLNSIVSVDGDIYILEACGFRFGYGAIYALLELIPNNVTFAEMVEALIKSHNDKTDAADDFFASMGHYPTFGGHLRVFVHPSPLQGLSKELENEIAKTLWANKPVVIDNQQIQPCRFYPQDMYYDDVLGWHMVGVDGVLMELTYGGETIEEVASALYDAAKGVHIDGIYYRYPDGFERAADAIEELVLKYKYLPDYLL